MGTVNSWTTYTKIARFLTIFSCYYHYLNMIVESANERVLIVRNPFERKRIHEHKKKIKDLRVMLLKMLSKAGRNPLNY